MSQTISRETCQKTLQGLALLCIILFWVRDTSFVFLLAAMLLIAGSLLAWPPFLWFARVWIRTMNTLGRGLTRIILVLLYGLLIVPFSVIYKKANPQLEKHFFDKNRPSMFYDAEAISARHFEKTW